MLVVSARQGAPSTIRCIETRGVLEVALGITHKVREHPAPSGALRRRRRTLTFHDFDGSVREHPAPSGALRPGGVGERRGGTVRQGAPSTIRCIETVERLYREGQPLHPVREHPAPSGALRRVRPILLRLERHRVREHPAPSGALRRFQGWVRARFRRPVREHPAPSGALRRIG